MDSAERLRSGKGSSDENFPVASWLVHPHHRPIILAFYNFVRIADDIADHKGLSEADKLAHLDRLEESLLGTGASERVGVALRAALAERALAPDHAQDLLKAFRLDVTKLRYANWDELIGYCRFSAMPVGRFVLDVHGESRATWPANDALCAALQIINHLQDCGKDYRDLNRVYVPADAMAAAGTNVEALGDRSASTALLTCLGTLARRTRALLGESAPLPRLVNDTRLGMEISVIQTLARRLIAMLQERDPLSEKVHLGKGGVAALSALGMTKGLLGRLFRGGKTTLTI